MLRFLRSKWFIVSLITIAMLAVMGVSVNKYSGLNWLRNIISVPLSPVQSFFTATGRAVGNGLSYFRDMDAVRKENERLKAEISDLRTKNRELQALEIKNEELRQALNLKEQFSSYSIIGGNIIAVDPDNWFNVFKVDVGSRDGVRIDSPVLTSGKGLVGRVESTDLTSSRVLTIIDEDSAVSAWISKSGGGHAIVRGDLALKEKGLCRMDYIPLEVDVEVGDAIETSGLGGIFPKGILIGRVTEVRKTGSDLDRYAIIRPEADFKRLEEVFILKSNDMQETGSVK